VGVGVVQLIVMLAPATLLVFVLVLLLSIIIVSILKGTCLLWW
jgi:hypothetical protein